MRKKLNRCIVFWGAVFLLAACGGSEQASNNSATDKMAETKQLNIYNWVDYVDPTTISDFEKKYQVKINYSIYDTDEILEAKVLSGNSGYDLVAPSDSFIARHIQAGAYQKIDKSLIPNFKYVNPHLLKMVEKFDPGNQYAIPFFWSFNTMAINVEKVAAALGTKELPDNQWDLVFNPVYTAKLAQCGVSILDTPSMMIPLVLNYLGKDPNSTDKASINLAMNTLRKNRPYIKRFSSSGYVNDLARGDVCIAVGYNGDLNIAKRRMEETHSREHIRILLPKEGFAIGGDYWAIPHDATNVLNAHRYINWQLEPEVAARNGNYVTYAPSSLPARELMAPEFRDNETIFPSDDIFERAFIMKALPVDTLRQMMRQWQQFKMDVAPVHKK